MSEGLDNIQQEKDHPKFKYFSFLSEREICSYSLNMRVLISKYIHMYIVLYLSSMEVILSLKRTKSTKELKIYYLLKKATPLKTIGKLG